MSLHVSWDEYNALVERLALQVHESGWRFNQVICIARGGLRVGDVLSPTLPKGPSHTSLHHLFSFQQRAEGNASRHWHTVSVA